MTDWDKQPHRRFNPLTEAWVLVSPQRSSRPWQGQMEIAGDSGRPGYDPDCYLCPGNARAGDHGNPDYIGPFRFENDFPALLPNPAAKVSQDDRLFRVEPETGTCEVICFSHRHDLSVADLSLDEVKAVVALWKKKYVEDLADTSLSYTQIFENKGEMMGCSNPHPHCQVWSTHTIPVEPSKEQSAQEKYLTEVGSPLLLDYVQREVSDGKRIIYENDKMAVVVPFWATWPFETLILPKTHLPHLSAFAEDDLHCFAEAYQSVTRIYNRLFDCEFPYSAGIHQAPCTSENCDAWQLHMHFYPPLLRSATVRKFMVGYEMLATPQRDLTPEQAAAALRKA